MTTLFPQQYGKYNNYRFERSLKNYMRHQHWNSYLPVVKPAKRKKKK